MLGNTMQIAHEINETDILEQMQDFGFLCDGLGEYED